MNFIFDCSTRYRTSERSERVRYRVERVKIKFISTSWHVIFFYYINILLTTLTIFRRFPTTFRRFSKIFQNCSEGQTNVSEHFPKIADDNRRFPWTDRRCFDHTVTHLSTFKEIYVSFAVVILSLGKTTWYLHVWNNMLSSRVKISCLCAKAHLILHWCLYDKK